MGEGTASQPHGHTAGLGDVSTFRHGRSEVALLPAVHRQADGWFRHERSFVRRYWNDRVWVGSSRDGGSPGDGTYRQLWLRKPQFSHFPESDARRILLRARIFRNVV